MVYENQNFGKGEVLHDTEQGLVSENLWFSKGMQKKDPFLLRRNG